MRCSPGLISLVVTLGLMATRAEAQPRFQVNAKLLAHAAAGHVVLHCLPAYRGKEITEEVLEKHAEVIFQEAENRLHAQKAILVALAGK